MKKKFLSYGRQQISGEELKAVARVLTSNFITQGPEVARFERDVARWTGARYAVAVSSGTAALHIACLSAGFKKGDEVITTPLTFLATANSILYAGAKPVFADIDSESVCLDPILAEKKGGKKVKGLIAVDMAGHPCDVKAFKALCRRKKWTFIQDSSHSLGASAFGKKVGQWADMTIFSFHPVKTITTGEGGMVLTNDKKLYERLLLFRNHGIERRTSRLAYSSPGPWYYEMQALGFNYRMTDFQAAIGRVQLKKLSGFLAKRRKIVEFYRRELKGLSWLTLPAEKPGCRSAWHLFAPRINYPKIKKSRSDVFRILKSKGIGVQVHYIPLTRQPYYRRQGLAKGRFPKTEAYYRECLSLPLHPSLTRADCRRVVSEIRRLGPSA